MNLIKYFNLNIHQIIMLCILILKTTRCNGDNDRFCSCKKKDIDCKGIQDLDVLKSHFSDTVEKCSATKLHIKNSHLLALPNDLLKGTDIAEVKIENTYLPFLAIPVGDGNPFVGGNSVAKFSVESVRYLYNWKWEKLNVCQNLTELRISKSEMLYVGPKFKKLHLPHLNNLVIQNSGVRWIHDKAFAHLQNLAFFNFKNNYVRRFDRSLLPDPAYYLTVFNFRNNQLEYLEEDFFKNMPLLTYVNLEKNNLVTLSKFKNRSFFVNLAGNPLRCDCSIKWLNKATNQTDSYRLRCFDPDFYDASVLVRRVDWKKKDC